MIKRAAIITVLLSLCPSVAAAGLKLDKLDAGIIGAAALDLGTTEWAIRGAGAREGNPMLASGPVRFGGKTVFAAGIILAKHKLERDGHPKAAKAAGIIAISLWGIAAAHNARLAATHKRH